MEIFILILLIVGTLMIAIPAIKMVAEPIKEIFIDVLKNHNREYLSHFVILVGAFIVLIAMILVLVTGSFISF